MIGYEEPMLTTAAHSTGKFSARWMAYEGFFGAIAESDEPTMHTKASDIWAFGMVIYVSPINWKP